jgi:hypothetical protein
MASPYQEFVAKARARQSAAALGSKTEKVSGGLVFTKHSEYKMKQYGLSVQKVRGVIRSPKRREVGIIPHTVAVMQPVNPKKTLEVEKNRPAQNPTGNEAGTPLKEVWKQEVWVLYKESPGTKKIISAWRYPGVSPKRDPIPEDVLQEILEQSELE